MALTKIGNREQAEDVCDILVEHPGGDSLGLYLSICKPSHRRFRALNRNEITQERCKRKSVS